MKTFKITVFVLLTVVFIEFTKVYRFYAAAVKDIGHIRFAQSFASLQWSLSCKSYKKALFCLNYQQK